jgi:hypothetical protein
MKPADKKALLEKLESFGLQYKALSLTKREIVVHESNGHTAAHLNELFSRYIADETLTPQKKNGLLTVYAPLAACSAGDVPNEDDFYWMKDADVETWVREARALNPHLFARLSEQEQLLSEMSEEELAKKKKSRRRSK